MLKNHHRKLSALLMSFDLTLTTATFVALMMTPALSGLDAATILQHPSTLAFSAIGIVAWPVAFHAMDLYASMRTSEVSRVLARFGASAMVTSTVLAAVAHVLAAPVSPAFPFICGFAQFAVLGFTRTLLFVPLRAARRRGRNYRNVVIVGTGPRGAYVKRTIESNPDWGLRVIGFVDEFDAPIDPSLYNAKTYNLDDMHDLLRHQVIDRVIIAYPRSMLSALSPVVEVCASAGIPFTMLSDLFGDFLPPPRVTQFGTFAALDFAPVHHSKLMLSIKRGIDMVGASVALVLTLPVLGLAALAIRLDDGGPVFFRQIRCGLHGRPFTILKLRTMTVDAEQRKSELAGANECTGPIFKMRRDPRITRVGRILRKLSIDELPQLWNVLKGDMSLVGPRPPVPEEVVQYQTFERRRLSMRPGITCIWQVSGRSRIGFDRWVQLDVKYIDSWSLALDLAILFRTIPAVLKGDGAH